MTDNSVTFALEDGLDLRKLVTTGSVLHISEDFDENCSLEPEKPVKNVDFIGQPVESIEQLEKTMITVDESGFVKKKILEEGGGLPLHDGNTVTVAYSGFWEGDLEPFDCRKLYKPLEVNLQDSGVLPGFDMSIRSMLVGELSVFILNYQVMYGELGIPPRIRPKSNCIFYVKLLKSVITEKERKIDFSEPNMFHKVEREVQILMSTGITFHNTNNIQAAIQLFRKSVFMLHKCRLADAKEEKIQESLLAKLYLNLANCYNKTKQPLKACTACNELKRLNKFWNNHKALYANAKALRMIGQFDAAEKRLKKAMHLKPNNEKIKEEFKILCNDRDICNQNKLIIKNIGPKTDVVKPEFKDEVHKLIRKFKDCVDLCNLDIPSGLNSSELAYLQETCTKEKLFLNKKKIDDMSPTNEDDVGGSQNAPELPETIYSLGKFEPTPWDADIEALQDKDCEDFWSEI